MQGNEYTLPNGLRIIHEPTLSKVAYCGFAIDAGTYACLFSFESAFSTSHMRNTCV